MPAAADSGCALCVPGCSTLAAPVAEGEHVHHVGAPRQRPAGQAAGDDLRERREVGRDADQRLRAAGRPAEARHDLVEDDERAVRARRRRDATRRARAGAARRPRRRPSARGSRRRRRRARARASSAPAANGSTTVRSGFGGEPTRRLAIDRQRHSGLASSCQPWKWPASLSTRLRPVKPRATRSASSVASVPLEVKRTRSALGTRRDDALGPGRLLLAARAEVLPSAGLARARPRRRPDGSGRRRARRAPSRSRARRWPSRSHLYGALGARDAGRERILPARVVREAAREEPQRALVRGLRARIRARVLGQGREGGAHAANATAGPARV